MRTHLQVIKLQTAYLTRFLWTTKQDLDCGRLTQYSLTRKLEISEKLTAFTFTAKEQTRRQKGRNSEGHISLKYNQQDTTFSRYIYFYKLLYIFQAVPPPIIRSTKLYIQRRVRYCQTNTAAIVDEMELSSISSTIAAGSINCSTYFRRFLRPSSGAQNCTYSVRYCQNKYA